MPREFNDERPKSDQARATQFAVRLDPSHPAGRYQRAGTVFLSGKDVLFAEVPALIREDPWLMVTMVTPGQPPTYSSRDRFQKQAGRRL